MCLSRALHSLNQLGSKGPKPSPPVISSAPELLHCDGQQSFSLIHAACASETCDLRGRDHAAQLCAAAAQG